LTKLLAASIDKLQANKHSVLVFAVWSFSDALATASQYRKQFIKYKTQWKGIFLCVLNACGLWLYRKVCSLP